MTIIYSIQIFPNDDLNPAAGYEWRNEGKKYGNVLSHDHINIKPYSFESSHIQRNLGLHILVKFTKF